jgi:hypothetical protein
MKYLSLVFVITLLLAASLSGAEPLDENIARLVSPVSAERRAGEAWLAEHGQSVISGLIEHVERGEPKDQTAAIQKMTLLISPWQRGVEMGNRHHGQIELFRPMRPVGRPVDHPQAARLRDVLMATLKKSLAEVERKPQLDDANAASWRHSAIGEASSALAEVADNRTAQEIRELLEKQLDAGTGSRLLHAQEIIYGLPPFYQIRGLCGVGLTPELLRERQKREATAFDKQKRELLDWLDQHAGQPLDQRIDATIGLWRKRLAANPAYYFSRGNDSPILVLARLGDAAIPALRRQQAREPILLWRGLWEVVAATISGKVDDALVRDLINSKHLADPNHHLLALEIIALADSRAYQKELAGMLSDQRYSSHDVAQTLAVVHRKDAIGLLQMQPTANYTAHLAVKELESWPE